MVLSLVVVEVLVVAVVVVVVVAVVPTNGVDTNGAAAKVINDFDGFRKNTPWHLLGR